MIKRIDPENTNLPRFLIPVFLKIQDRFRRNCEPIIVRFNIIGKQGEEKFLFESKPESIGNGYNYLIPITEKDKNTDLPENEWREMMAEKAVQRGLSVSISNGMFSW